MSDSVSQEVNLATKTQKVKEEPVELEHQKYGYSLKEMDQIDQLTISQHFLSAKKSFDFSHKADQDMPLSKRGRSKIDKIETADVMQVPDHNHMKSERCKRQRVKIDMYDSSEAKASAVLEQAKEIQANLVPEFPSFIKLMLRSHVTHGFWLGLPLGFCKLHLPRVNDIIILEGDNGKDYKTNYLAGKGGLSGGWRGFSLAHRLVEGDVLIFHLVQHLKFKVYIVRSNASAEADGALDLLTLDARKEEMDDEKGCEEVEDSSRYKKAGEKHAKPLSQICEEDIQKTLTTSVTCSIDPTTDQTDSGEEDLSSDDDMEDFGSSGKFVCFENFNIVLNGSSIESELPKHLKKKYYELCCTRKSYLHHHLVKSINPTLATGIIIETINIADAIRACNLTIPQRDLATWDKSLEAFEQLGMDVGFLRIRLKQLMILASDPERISCLKRFVKARIERERAQKEMTTLELQIMNMRRTVAKLDDEIETQKKNEKMLIFKETANAPW